MKILCWLGLHKPIAFCERVEVGVKCKWCKRTLASVWTGNK